MPSPDLESLLEAQNAALASGDIGKLLGMARPLESALKRLESARPGRDVLVRIQRRADRNARLVEAALKGLSEARARLEASTQGQRAFVTYAPSGQTRLLEDRSARQPVNGKNAK